MQCTEGRQLMEVDEKNIHTQKGKGGGGEKLSVLCDGERVCV